MFNMEPLEFLDFLKKNPLLAPFQLALYSQQDPAAGGERKFHLFGDRSRSDLTPACVKSRQHAVRHALRTSKPVAFECPKGQFNFAIPLQTGAGATCLVGAEIRNPAPASAMSAAALRELAPLPIPLHLSRPVATLEEMQEVANRLHRLLPELIRNQLPALALSKVTEHLQVLTGVSEAVGRARTISDVASLLCEALSILFDLSTIAIIVEEQQGQKFTLQGSVGLSPEAQVIDFRQTASFLSRIRTGKAILVGREIQSVFPGSDAKRAICLPLVLDEEGFGLIALFDAILHGRDLLLLELLCGRVAAKVRELQREPQPPQERLYSTRLLAMTSALAQVEVKEDLYQTIVEMASELLDASTGSLMLPDESGEHLRIVAAKGMNTALARTMQVKVGTGIAGKVAKSGFPLLVNDIEKDSRIAIPNRPRFKTKSFISIPLRLKDKTIGVLNLSDKESLKIFTEVDLNLLTSFVAHAAVMIERAASRERTSLLEELAMTDPLTELYNRRFFEKRLEEELSRSSRYNLPFSLMMIDLDHFKTYNDLCGHIAGDESLKKAAALMRGAAREMDVVARYGGEEFCILLPETSKKEALLVAERMRQSIEDAPFPGENLLPQGCLTASIGVSAFPVDGTSAVALINTADIALYQAKNSGRNRIGSQENPSSPGKIQNL